jgi:hypothetical protein
VPSLARALAAAVEGPASAPAGFDRASLMSRLVGVYEQAVGARTVALAGP